MSLLVGRDSWRNHWGWMTKRDVESLDRRVSFRPQWIPGVCIAEIESGLFCVVLGHWKRSEETVAVANSGGGLWTLEVQLRGGRAGAWRRAGSTSADAESIMDPPIYYSKAEFIETVRLFNFFWLRTLTFFRIVQDTGNKVSRRATIAGPQNIILGGKTVIASGAIIRGDLRRSGPGHAVVISLGRYCLIGEGCIMRFVYLTRISTKRSCPWLQASV